MSWDLLWRGVQVAGGTLEVVGGGVMAGVGALGAPVTGGTSLLATVGGAAIGAHGLDQIYAGLTGAPSVASQLGGAAVGALLGDEYAYIGQFLGDLGPVNPVGIWKGVKGLPQLFKNIRAIPGRMKTFIDDLRSGGKLTQTLKGLPDEEISDMLRRGEITDKDLIEAGLDPAKYKGGAKTSLSRHQKAAIGEQKAHELLAKKGSRIDNGGEYKPGQNGIDGVYKNSSPPPEYTIMEAKYDTSRLGNTSDGRQMSDGWVDARLDKAVGKVEADNIRDAMLRGEVEKVVINVKPDGSALVKPVDGAGRIIK